MSLAARLADWREDFEAEGEADPDEAALRQFVYVAISDYLEEYPSALVAWLTNSDSDELPHPEWVDEYAVRPRDEPSGSSRPEWVPS